MKRIGIIQPGKIGDIIILLPVAKHYNDMGFEVLWPIDKNIINNFIGYVDYVTFIPCEFDCEQARQICKEHECEEIVDVSFYIPGATTQNEEAFCYQNVLTFDQMKYKLANVPFEKKWNLKINRNYEFLL